MGQIVKRKKKGRPSKADLARRAGGDHQASESDTRRSLRRRNVRYNIDIDDYVDEDDEDERRREKKLKLVLKLPHEKGGAESGPYRGRFDARGNNAPESGVSGSSSEYGNKTTKKRRIDRGDSDDDDYNNDDDDDDDDCDEVRLGLINGSDEVEEFQVNEDIQRGFGMVSWVLAVCPAQLNSLRVF